MDTTIVASLIGTLGAAFITVLIYFLLSLRDGIRAVSDRIDSLGSGLEARLGARIDEVRSDLGARIDEVRSDLGARIDKVESGLEARLGARIDKVESGLEVRLGGRIDEVKSDLGGRIDKVESRLTTIDEKLVRIEATQEGHGLLLTGMADHGERIAALEDAVAATA